MINHTLKDIAERIKSSDDFVLFCLGDSITQGIGAKTDEDTYVACLARNFASAFNDRQIERFDGKLRDCPTREYYPLERYDGPIIVNEGKSEKKITVVRCGVGGNTVKRLLSRKEDYLSQQKIRKSANLYTINLGINDSISADKDKFTLPDDYEKNLNVLLDEIEKVNPQADIILMTPTYNDFGTDYTSTVDPYAKKMLCVATKRNVPVIDLHELWMKHLVIGKENYGHGDWLTGNKGDTCHPSSTGHKALADFIFNSIFAIE